MISLVYSYYENGGMLDRHLAEWQRYPDLIKPEFRIVVVDDGSPKDRAEKHLREVGIPIELYRIHENIPWNVPGARNLGMNMASTKWCLLTDIDHLLPVKSAERLAARMPALKNNCAYVLGRRWADGRELYPHGNTYILEKAVYWACGGTNEDFSGVWGAGEGQFRRHLKRRVAIVDLPDIVLNHFGRDDIADASTRDWGRRGSKWDHSRDSVFQASVSPSPRNPFRFSWERIV